MGHYARSCLQVHELNNLVMSKFLRGRDLEEYDPRI